jgi:hypothetical protein
VSDNKAAAAEDKFYTKLGVPLSGLQTAIAAIERNRYTGNVVCLVGEAGLGKSQIVRQIAARRKPDNPGFTWNDQVWTDSSPIHAMYLAHALGEDISVPYPTRVKLQDLLERADKLRVLSEFAKPHDEKVAAKLLEQALEVTREIAHTDGNAVNGTVEYLINKELKDLPPEGILFLDEWNRADKSVIKAFFTLIEDSAVHGIKVIPDGIQIVAAMNPSDGAYSVNEAEKDPAFRRRLSFVAITFNSGSWIRYASGEGNFHPFVVDFIKSLPEQLYDTKLRAANKQFPCPASWEKVSTLLHQAEKEGVTMATDPGVHACIQGHIGEAPALNFIEYIKDNEIVISPTEVLEGYTEKSKVRRKVRRMVDLARNDVIGELCTSVAISLMNTQPDVENVAPFLALFMRDLQPEMAVSMIVHKFGGATEGVDNAESYINKLSVALHTQPPYRDLFNKIGDAMTKARAEMDGEKKADPLA